MDIPEGFRRQVARNREFPDFAEALPGPRNARLQLLTPQRIVAIGIHSTISKDNTAGEGARHADLLAHLGKKTRDCTERATQGPIEQLGISHKYTEGRDFGDDFGDDFEREIHPLHHMSYEEQFKHSMVAAPLETHPTPSKTAPVPSRGILRPPRDSLASSSSALFGERPSIQPFTPNERQPATSQRASDNEITGSRDASPDEYRSSDSYWANPVPDYLPRTRKSDGFPQYATPRYTTPSRTPSPRMQRLGSQVVMGSPRFTNDGFYATTSRSSNNQTFPRNNGVELQATPDFVLYPGPSELVGVADDIFHGFEDSGSQGSQSFVPWNSPKARLSRPLPPRSSQTHEVESLSSEDAISDVEAFSSGYYLPRR